MKPSLPIGLALCVSICISSTALADLGCQAVLDNTGHNVRHIRWTQQRLAYAYEHLCKNRHQASSSSESLVIGVVIEGLPITADGSGERSAEKTRQWCSENSQFENAGNSAALFESIVVIPAVEAWRECKRYEAYSILVTPAVSPDAMVVDFTIVNRTTDERLRLMQVFSSEPTAECSLAGLGESIPIALPVLRGIGVHCERRSLTQKLPDGPERQFVPAVTISLFTEAAADPLQISLPAVEPPVSQLTSKEALALSERLAGLEKSRFTFRRVDSVTKQSTSKGKRHLAVSEPVLGAALCVLSGKARYGGASGSCSVSGDSVAGWILSASSRGDDVSTTCTMTCYSVAVDSAAAESESEPGS